MHLINRIVVISAKALLSVRIIQKVKTWMPVFAGMTMLLLPLFYIQSADARVIKFATEATYPPFVYMDNRGDIHGFDIDIAMSICRVQRLDCSFTNQPWDSLIPSLKFGKFDALIGAISITIERQAKVAFTAPYYENTADYIIAANKTDFSVVPGSIIGVQAGTTLADYLAATYGDKIQINRYASAEQAFLDLIATRLDAVFGDTPIVKHWIKQAGNKQFRLAGMPVRSIEYLGRGFGIAVRKDDKHLLTSLNRGLAKIKANGQYDAIYNKYFS